MSKAEIVAELEAMVASRLFNGRPWLADRETLCVIHERLIKMGLVEHLSSDTWRHTPLGKELDTDLFAVFMGVFDVWDALSILEDHRLIDEPESDSICERLLTTASPESVLEGYVRRAYFDYRKATKYLH